jgi:isocitrate dehydrogenase
VKQQLVPGCRKQPCRACRDYLISIKGPLTTPIRRRHPFVGTALRRMLDLAVCLRPVTPRFQSVPSDQGSKPKSSRMVIFRCEELQKPYAGIEFENRIEPALVHGDLQAFPEDTARSVSRGIGIQAVSRTAPAPDPRRSNTRSVQAKDRSPWCTRATS